MALGKQGDEQEDLFVTHRQLTAQSLPCSLLALAHRAAYGESVTDPGSSAIS